VILLTRTFTLKNEELKGICMASEDGVVAMLNPQNGDIIWRNYPPEGQTLQRFTAKSQCKLGDMDSAIVRNTI